MCGVGMGELSNHRKELGGKDIFKKGNKRGSMSKAELDRG